MLYIMLDVAFTKRHLIQKSFSSSGHPDFLTSSLSLFQDISCSDGFTSSLLNSSPRVAVRHSTIRFSSVRLLCLPCRYTYRHTYCVNLCACKYYTINSITARQLSRQRRTVHHLIPHLLNSNRNPACSCLQYSGPICTVLLTAAIDLSTCSTDID